MEQPNFRVKFPLASKLVLSLSVLFLLVVGFLSASAILLMIEDKQAYTFQYQAMEAYVIGRDFDEKARGALDNVRIYMTTFDPRQAVTKDQDNALQNIVRGQAESLGIVSFLVKPNGGEVKNLTQTPNAETLKKMNLALDARFAPSAAFFGTVMPKLLADAFVIVPYLRADLPPLAAVIFADVGLKDYKDGMPVAVDFVDASRFITGRRIGELTVANLDGSVLYASNRDRLSPGFRVLDEPLFQAAIASKISSGTRDYTVGDVRYLGAFQKNPYGQVILTQLNWKKAMAAAFTLGERFVILGLISITTAILFAIFFSRSITAPLKRLFQATQKVAQGDFGVDPNVKTRDEVGQLSNAFVLMSKKIKELISETIKKAHLDEELKVAAAVQESLIPPPEYRDDQLEIIGHYQSAAECGGDWWGFFRVGNKLVAMIADATGHGVPSALVTAAARSCFSVLNKLAHEHPDYVLRPGKMMSYANKSIFDAATTKIMMTFFICVIDLDRKTLTYANAGHNPPWLYRKNGDKFQTKSLISKGSRLGESEDGVEYEEVTLPCEPGDLLFMYTDGLVENKNKAGDQYGKKRAKRIVDDGVPGGPKALIDSLVKDYRAYNEDKLLDDDVTLAAISVLPA